MRNYFCLMALLCLIVHESSAKTAFIKGKIINGLTKKPIPGATVAAKANTKEATTGYGGDFIIEISEDDTFRISCKGYIGHVMFVSKDFRGKPFIINLYPEKYTSSISRDKQTPLKHAKAIQPLNIGENLPTLTFYHLINSPTPSLDLSKLEGKAVLMDFFATWCFSCIQSLPKLDSIQRKFPDNLRIIMVAYEPMEKIRSFLKTHPKLPTNRLIFITDDSLLKKYFPNIRIPHVVWADGDSRIAAFTGGDAVKIENVSDLIDRKTMHLPMKRDIINYSSKFTMLENAGDLAYENLYNSTTMSGYIEGLGSKSGTYQSSSTTRHYFLNRPMLTMYQFIYNFPNNRLVLEVKNSQSYTYYEGISDDQKPKKLFCYETIVPKDASLESVKKKMLMDLDYHFGTIGKMEIRAMPCWALVKKERSSPIKNFTTSNISVPSDTLKDVTMAYLIARLNDFKMPTERIPIVVDESGIDKKLSILLPKSLTSDMPVLQEALSKIGLELIKVQRHLEVFVLKDAGR